MADFQTNKQIVKTLLDATPNVAENQSLRENIGWFIEEDILEGIELHEHHAPKDLKRRYVQHWYEKRLRKNQFQKITKKHGLTKETRKLAKRQFRHAFPSICRLAP